ncbi:MAG: S49 family peptidase, partial [Rhodospirillaceae bacterium]
KRALDLGLVDGLGEITAVMQEKFGDKTRFVPVEERKGWLKQKMGVWSAPQMDTRAWADNLIAAVEERLIWNRFGL